MYRFNDRCNMGPRGRMNGHRGFRPEIFLGIIGLMFFGWIILAVIGGLLGAGFMVLVGALMPAVLFEIGFISNPEDEAYMMTDAGQKDIAKRISKAVSTYKAAVHSYRETLGR